MSGYCPDCGNTLCICDELQESKSTQTELPLLTYPRYGMYLNELPDYLKTLVDRVNLLSKEWSNKA